MKTILITGFFFLAFVGMQSCTKCGHCQKTDTFGTTSTITRDPTVCGNDYYKAGKINCEANQSSSTTSYKWVDDK